MLISILPFKKRGRWVFNLFCFVDIWAMNTLIYLPLKGTVREDIWEHKQYCKAWSENVLKYLLFQIAPFILKIYFLLYVLRKTLLQSCIITVHFRWNFCNFKSMNPLNKAPQHVFYGDAATNNFRFCVYICIRVVSLWEQLWTHAHQIFWPRG